MGKILILVIGWIVASPSQALTSKWFTSEIKTIYPLSTGDFVLIFKQESLNCTNGSKYHYVREGNNGVTREGVKSMLSTALVAASTGKEVTISFDTDSQYCSINRLYVSF